MYITPFKEWRKIHGRFLETLGEAEECTTCLGTAQDGKWVCTSCSGVGYFTVNPETGEPLPCEELNPSIYCRLILKDIKRWGEWSGQSIQNLRRRLEICCEGTCPLTDQELDTLNNQSYMSGAE
jgi:hypothetical protein